MIYHPTCNLQLAVPHLPSLRNHAIKKEMITQEKLSVRNAEHSDRASLANLIHYQTHSHRHLDWRSPLDWIDHPPFLVAEQWGQLVAALACPPDPPEVAWIQVFSVNNLITPDRAWQTLWPQVRQELAQSKITLAAITLQDWLRELLAASGFVHTHSVVHLAWEEKALPPPRPAEVTLRPLTSEDLPRVQEVDAAAFTPLWRNSPPSLKYALKQAAVATVAENEAGIVGYQISTPNMLGGHLARLAVHPDAQGQGVAYTLVRDMMAQFQKRGALRVSVNTQNTNQPSLKLYSKLGFQPTGESHPVHQYHFE